ncbi:A24 family peptidase [Salinisphaera sp. P385]|uniref:Prepilin leader peptidase/N-methyltransferase n=1 Tax=Spectribacter acetivorans TaxID=3075603 RepID=A0ABU3B6K1_9GAMM|nr:A24 family peptidase [Salinisphaera sp. P385]MDT0618064.1 A24 family peptidase [Salinisphaera sp. P385]
MLDLLAAQPGLYIAVLFVLGLLVGSFLNVVILRLPVMLDHAWRTDAAMILEQPGPTEQPPGIAGPASACPACGQRIRAWQNVPVLSYLLLRGRCASCRAPISVQYPLVELAAGLLAATVAWQFGVTLPALLALIYTWMLLALTGIDWRTQFLPDLLTLPLLWLGLLASLGGAFAQPADAIVGAAAGYGALWLVFQGFRLTTGKEGMGYGDFKLLAAIGAWLGWQALPLVVILASVAGAVVGLAMMAGGRLQRGNPMPFGPFLAIAGWLALVAGDTITAAYFQLAGLG